MSTEQIPLDPAHAQAYRSAANQLMNGKSAVIVRSGLVASGVPEEHATTVVSDLSKRISEAKRQKAKKDILYGALWCGGGLLVTLITYSAASSGGGGRYVVTWGAIIFGGIQLIRGLMNYANP